MRDDLSYSEYSDIYLSDNPSTSESSSESLSVYFPSSITIFKMGSIAETHTNGNSVPDGHFPKPLKQSGALEKFEFEDVTPVMGREFPKTNIVDDLINSPNADTLLRDLAITSKFPPPLLV